MQATRKRIPRAIAIPRFREEGNLFQALYHRVFYYDLRTGEEQSQCTEGACTRGVRYPKALFALGMALKIKRRREARSRTCRLLLPVWSEPSGHSVGLLLPLKTITKKQRYIFAKLYREKNPGSHTISV